MKRFKETKEDYLVYTIPDTCLKSEWMTFSKKEWDLKDIIEVLARDLAEETKSHIYLEKKLNRIQDTLDA